MDNYLYIEHHHELLENLSEEKKPTEDEYKEIEEAFGNVGINSLKTISEIYENYPNVLLFFQVEREYDYSAYTLINRYASKGIRCEKCNRIAKIVCPICRGFLCRYHGGTLRTLIRQGGCLICSRLDRIPKEIQELTEGIMMISTVSVIDCLKDPSNRFIPEHEDSPIKRRDLITSYRKAIGYLQEGIDEGLKEVESARKFFRKHQKNVKEKTEGHYHN